MKSKHWSASRAELERPLMSWARLPLAGVRRRIREDRRRSDEIEALLLAKFARWEVLEEARK